MNLSRYCLPQTVNLSLYSPRAQGTVVTLQMLAGPQGDRPFGFRVRRSLTLPVR